jgi:Fe-S-cluster-containing hydrogenase component 2
MMAYKITDKCESCGSCKDECPNDAIEEVDGAFKINTEKCEDCGSCIDVCPNEAICEC